MTTPDATPDATPDSTPDSTPGVAARRLRLYGSASEHPPLDWSWAQAQLVDAGTYWVVAGGHPVSGHPHPRPVWGVWMPDGVLHLSIGSPSLVADLAADPAVTVHLGSGTDVVIVEGTAGPASPTPPLALAAYDHKYDWHYQVSELGELTAVRAARVLAWRSAGRAGRDGFRSTGRWDVLPPAALPPTAPTG